MPSRIFSMLSTNLHYWLAALHLPDIGPRTILQWLDHFITIDALFNASSAERQAIGLSRRHSLLLDAPNWPAVERDLTWLQAAGHALIAFDADNYPPLLKTLSDPPLVLYVLGDPAVLTHHQLAIVGARNATPAGLNHAEQFSYHLAAAGFTITSGLALGIDAASHRGALTAQGITIGVMATGINQIYPSSHRQLAAEIADHGGAIISEFPLSTPPKAGHFPRRNRIISGLSRGVLVVEAAIKSGSLITARHALEQGRDVFAIPGSIHNPLTRGCHYLIRQGAKLVETAGDILEELAPQMTPIPAQSSSTSPAIPAACRKLLANIDYDVTPIDMIIFRSRLTASEVSSMLLVLELHGYIQSVTGGYMRTAVI
jgi:DNA processing protein